MSETDFAAMSDDEVLQYLEAAIPRIRKRAASVGSMHGGWETIADIETLLKGEPLPWTNYGLRDVAATVANRYPPEP